MLAVAYVYQQMDEEIRRRVEEKFAQHYPDLKVTVHSAEFVEGEGIRIRGLSIFEPQAEGPRAELVQVEEVFVACRADLAKLISGELETTRIVLRRPTVRLTRRPNGTWSVEKLLPPPKFTSHHPEIEIENGTVEIFDPLKDPSGVLTLRVNLRLTPVRDPQQPQLAPSQRKLQGTLSGDFLRHVKVEGLVDLDPLGWTIDGAVEGLEISPQMRSALPDDLATRLEPLGSLRGLVDLGFRFQHDPSAEPPWRFDVAGQLAGGRIDDPRLPDPLADLRAAFRVNNEGIIVENLLAASGPARLHVKAFQLGGFSLDCPMWLDAEVRELELDERLRRILPDALREEWDKYAPAGRVDGTVKLSGDGRTWKPQEVSVQSKSLSFAYYKFPYRLRGATGSLELKNDVLSMDLTGTCGSRPVRVWGEVFHPAREPAFWLKAAGDDLPLDEALFDALRATPGKAYDVVRALDPRGRAGFFWHVWRDQPGQPMHRHLDLVLNGCSMKYERFPYPLGNIHGTLEMNGTVGTGDDRWEFRDLEGTNDTGVVRCDGHFGPTPYGQELVLNLSGTDVPLEEELRDALPHPNMRRLWNDLKPQGTVDLKDIVVRYVAGQKRAHVTFRAEPKPGTMSIEPAYCPYRVGNLAGTLSYSDGHVAIEGFRGEHGRTTLSAAVDCNFLSDGSWHLHLDKLFVDRLHLDRDLMQALPERLRKALTQLSPTGPINVKGTVDVASGGNPGDRPASQWDVDLFVSRGSIDCGVKLENVYGGLKLVGGYDGERFHSRGQLAVDYLTCKNIPFTQISGPIWIDDGRVLLGTEAPPSAAEPPRPITALLFGEIGGTVAGSGWVALGPNPRYRLQATLTDADLSRCARQWMAGNRQLRGRAFARVVLQGSGPRLDALDGAGELHLRDADIYELPLMIALLSILSIKEPDRTAFRTADMNFRIKGGHVYLTNIAFNGDAIRLEGSGLMEFDSSIQLTFRALLGRREWQPLLLRKLLGEASEEIVMIHVGGTLQHPVQRSEPFPRVNQALRDIQSEVERTTGLPPLLPQAGPAIFPGRGSPLIRR